MRNCELEKIYAELKALGYDRVRSGKGHWKVVNAAGKAVATGPSSNGEWRAVKNWRSQLRKAGVLP